jgi:LemA protein
MKWRAWVFIGVVAIIGLWGVGASNRFVGLDQNVKSSWAQVESNLQRRADLIPNLVSTVKGSANVDKEVYAHLADARAKLGGGGGYSPDRVKAANEFEGALSRLLVVVENYPQLASQQGFRQLQDELAGTENRINVARKDYNDAVREYNAAIAMFPASVVAGFSGRKAAPYFEASPEGKQVPKVSF